MEINTNLTTYKLSNNFKLNWTIYWKLTSFTYLRLCISDLGLGCTLSEIIYELSESLVIFSSSESESIIILIFDICKEKINYLITPI